MGKSHVVYANLPDLLRTETSGKQAERRMLLAETGRERLIATPTAASVNPKTLDFLVEG